MRCSQAEALECEKIIRFLLSLTCFLRQPGPVTPVAEGQEIRFGAWQQIGSEMKNVRLETRVGPERWLNHAAANSR